MQIYNYHPITKEYIGLEMADESPLEEKVYLIPANATQIKPPSISKNQVAIFEDNKWIVKPDFRGEVFYKKSTSEAFYINDIGDLPEGLTNLKPDNHSDIWDSQSSKWVVNPKQAILQRLTAIYEDQDILLQAQFESTRNKFIAAFMTDDLETMNAFLNSPHIPVDLAPIVAQFKAILGKAK